MVSWSPRCPLVRCHYGSSTRLIALLQRWFVSVASDTHFYMWEVWTCELIEKTVSRNANISFWFSFLSWNYYYYVYGIKTEHLGISFFFQKFFQCFCSQVAAFFIQSQGPFSSSWAPFSSSPGPFYTEYGPLWKRKANVWSRLNEFNF